ncbi:DUF1579 domain-containing protein [Sinorhizobium sp. BG8]|uniref:DUF1579 domain-containing protein n=1 Tax=Sinorhizobium sp. BG8 TaxID=2613773 RepID=UPI00193D3C4D|nr:DUF1579 domain-containing protein [Sinorhizobium sp. BG8]QRM54646.1 DUF1579 domain-containing protein [Sinorhizobium sp. BG8]
MQAEISTQHLWLERLVGDWSVAADAITAPPPDPKWSEHARTIGGGLWLLCEGQGEMPAGGPGQTLMTLGFDPVKDRYVGTWAGSMMTHLWIYEGILEPTGNVLTLSCEGPDFENPKKSARYRDVITFIDEDHRTLTALIQQTDGRWHKLMELHYWRQK